MKFLCDVNPKDLDVLVRLDLDLPQEGKKFDTTRMEDSFETLSYLWKHKAKHVTVIAHRGHHVKATSAFSLEPIAELLYEELLKEKTFSKAKLANLTEWLDVLENLRFDSREEKGDAKFAKELAKGHDLFVNEAFATSHRNHTSITFLPKVLPTVFGFHFEKELEVMKKITASAKRPYIFVLGGAKLETKLPLLEKISEQVDVVLLGGKLAAEARSQNYKNRKMIIAELTEDGLDITHAAAEQFERFISDAKTLVWNGPMGKFEDGKHDAGTKYVGECIARAGGLKVVGGGDTEAAITQLKLNKGRAFTFISSGGGAMLEYLAHHTLPAIEAVK
jgi:phosphoglycerate kinase